MNHRCCDRDEPSTDPERVLSDSTVWFMGWCSLFIITGLVFAFGMKFLVGTEDHHETAGIVLSVAALVAWGGLMFAAYRHRP
jgi:hypothetical protein